MTPAERFHTRQRLAERYGLHVSSDELFKMAKAIAHGQGTLLARQTRHVVHWRFDYQGQALRLVFDRRRRAIITALPPLTGSETAR
jgi:hypothetical protein